MIVPQNLQDYMLSFSERLPISSLPFGWKGHIPSIELSGDPCGSSDCLRRWHCLYCSLPWYHRWQRIYLQCDRPGFDPWVKRIPQRREWQPTPIFLPGESHGQRSLVGYRPWSCKESDTTEWLTLSLCWLSTIEWANKNIQTTFSDFFLKQRHNFSLLFRATQLFKIIEAEPSIEELCCFFFFLFWNETLWYGSISFCSIKGAQNDPCFSGDCTSMNSDRLRCLSSWQIYL